VFYKMLKLEKLDTSIVYRYCPKGELLDGNDLQDIVQNDGEMTKTGSKQQRDIYICCQAIFPGHWHTCTPHHPMMTSTSPQISQLSSMGTYLHVTCGFLS
jgi:hypothetical protein